MKKLFVFLLMIVNFGLAVLAQDSTPEKLNISSDLESHNTQPHFLQKNFLSSDLSLGFLVGSVLFWGDGSDDVLLPFGKYFDAAERNLSLSLFYETKVYSWMGVQTKFIKGKANGTREFWSTGAPANFRFETQFLQFDLQANVYPFGFFENLSSSRIQPFGSFGAGFTAYRSAKYHLITGTLMNYYGYDDERLSTSGGYMADFVVPFGFGADIHVWKNWSARIQTSFVYVNSDKFDGHVGMGTDINDMYTHTSVGVKFTFGKNEHKDARYKPHLVSTDADKPVDIVKRDTTEPEDVVENTDILQDTIQEVEIVEMPEPDKEKELVEGVEFRVQILATKRPWASPETLASHLGVHNYQVYQETHNGLEKYTAGNFKTYEEARRLRDELRSGKVNGAFVVGYVNGVRVKHISEIYKK